METRKRLSDAELKSKLIECFENGMTIKTNCYDFLRTDFALMKERVFESFDNVYLDWSVTKENAQSEQVGVNAKEALRVGLKAKFCRQLEIQNKIGSIENLLSDGKTVQTFIINGEGMEIQRNLTPSEIASYTKIIVSLHIELSKMDGSYAPVKTESNLNDTEFIIERHPAHEAQDRIKRRPVSE